MRSRVENFSKEFDFFCERRKPEPLTQQQTLLQNVDHGQNQAVVLGGKCPEAKHNRDTGRIIPVLFRLVDCDRYGRRASKVVGLFLLHLRHPGHDQLLHGQFDLERNAPRRRRLHRRGPR